jgi:SAM-dependent methyltransferase
MINFCPLCSYSELQKSWLSTHFLRLFEFYKCRNCHSLICSPMPDEETLLKMYSGEYFEAENSNMFGRVYDYLNTSEKGVFLDYGCGSGRFSNSVHEMGWTTIGVEFSPDTVENLRKTFPFEIVQVGEKPSLQADVIHLADVLEHLTDLENQMPEILSLLKPGGIVIAHGPLEGNPNLFQKVIEYSRRLRGGAADIPPYHVMLATTKGQRLLFERFGLEELKFQVKQINFPAPDTFADSKGARNKALYLIRKASQLVTAEDNGNHYFYIGKKPQNQ